MTEHDEEIPATARSLHAAWKLASPEDRAEFISIISGEELTGAIFDELNPEMATDVVFGLVASWLRWPHANSWAKEQFLEMKGSEFFDGIVTERSSSRPSPASMRRGKPGRPPKPVSIKGVVYPSVTEAARAMGTTKANVSESIKRGRAGWNYVGG